MNDLILPNFFIDYFVLQEVSVLLAVCSDSKIICIASTVMVKGIICKDEAKK